MYNKVSGNAFLDRREKNALAVTSPKPGDIFVLASTSFAEAFAPSSD